MPSELTAKLKLQVIFWLARRLPTCREVTPWMSESLDNPLPLGRRIKLRLHILVCEYCKRYEEQLMALRNAVQAMASPPAESSPNDQPGLSADARERIKQALKNRDQNG